MSHLKKYNTLIKKSDEFIRQFSGVLVSQNQSPELINVTGGPIDFRMSGTDENTWEFQFLGHKFCLIRDIRSTIDSCTFKLYLKDYDYNNYPNIKLYEIGQPSVFIDSLGNISFNRVYSHNGADTVVKFYQSLVELIRKREKGN